jgi:CheY-like chemotaxis protein
MSALILVVDDEPDVADLFRQQFRRDVRANRFALDFALSGEEALGKVAQETDADLILILSDINMPGMSGLDMLPMARAARPDVPVIMITAYGDAETRRHAKAGGAEALFVKPIDFSELRRTIEARLTAIGGAAASASDAPS